jgi:hypothetical protein
VTDLATDSTVLEPHAETGASGAGAPVIPADDAKPESVRDAVSAAMKEEPPADAAKPDPDADKDAGEKAAEKGAEKPQGEEKVPEAKDAAKTPERGADGKFAGKEKEGDGGGAFQTEAAKPDAKPDNGRHIEAPSKFLPDAKETWRNTPRAVQRDVENMVREHETAVTQYRDAAERYEPLRVFDEAARQSGRAGVHESLAEVAQLEDLMGKNPLAALNQILLRAGPRKPDGSPVSLFEVAQTIVQMGQQGYQQTVARAQQQQQPQNDNSEVAQLKAQMAQMQAQQVAASVIEPFKRDHPRYDELKGDIALFLQSGKVPTSLSAYERLEAAYDMAVRINPASHVPDAPSVQERPDPDRRVDDPPAAKSIKSAPGSVSDDMEPQRGGSIKELLADELKRQRRA